MDLLSLRSDPEFMALPFEEKKKAIAVLDPSFGALHPDEQDRGLQMLFPRDVRETIAERKANPPAAAHGDPNAGGMSLLDVGGAIGKGLAHFVGMPTNMAELKTAMKDNVLNIATAGAHGIAKNAVGMLQDAMGGHVPIVGRPVEALSAPSVAVAHGNAPTAGENLGAIEAGTQLGATAVAAHPAVGAALGRAAEGAGGALDRSAQSGMASVVDPAGTDPLRAPIGDQLRNRGARMSNPPEDMARIAGEQGAPFRTRGGGVDVVADEVGQPGRRVAQNATPLTPEQEIWNATLDAAKDAQARQPIMAGAKGRALSEVVLGTAAKVLGVPHSVIAGVLGGSEVVGIARKVMTSPMWKTTSAVVKTDMANALRTGNMADALSIGAKVIGGIGLEDQYGHDQAVHDVVRSAVEQAQGNPQVARQILAHQEAKYVNPDGSEVPIPFSITRAFFNSIGLSNGNQPLAQRNAQGGQDQAGRQGGVSAGEGIARDFAGHATGPAPAELQGYRSGWGPVGTAPPLQRTSGREMAEWPVPANRVANENEQLLATHTPAQLLPERFVNARQVRYGEPISKDIRATVPDAPSDIYALYGTQFTTGPQSGRMGNTLDNTVLLNPQAQDMTDILAHETFHAVYNKDLTPTEKAQFKAFYDGALANTRQQITSAGIDQRDPDFARKASEIAKRMLPAAIFATLSDQGASDPSTRYDEAFSELGGQYMMNPTKFRETYPQIYGWYRQLIGKEYTAPKDETFVPLGPLANKPAWEYPGGMK